MRIKHQCPQDVRGVGICEARRRVKPGGRMRLLHRRPRGGLEVLPGGASGPGWEELREVLGFPPPQSQVSAGGSQ